MLGAIRIPPLARLSRPKNSEDPRTWVGTAWPGLRDVARPRLDCRCDFADADSTPVPRCVACCAYVVLAAH